VLISHCKSGSVRFIHDRMFHITLPHKNESINIVFSSSNSSAEADRDHDSSDFGDCVRNIRFPDRCSADYRLRPRILILWHDIVRARDLCNSLGRRLSNSGDLLIHLGFWAMDGQTLGMGLNGDLVYHRIGVEHCRCNSR